MHNIEHKPLQEEPASTPEQNGTTTAGRQKLPRVWRYALIGGTVLLVFAVIIAGLLFFTNQKAKQSSHTVPAATTGASTIPTPVAREATLPTPATTPIPAPLLSGYNVNVTVANGVIYINAHGGMLAALRASDGHQLWKRTLDTNIIQSSQPVNGVLYITTTKISLPSAARNASPLQGATALGALLWNTFQNVPAVQTLPYKQGLSSVYAIRASDGTVLWHYTLNNGRNSWASWLSVENGIVYASAANAEGTTGTGDMYALQSSNGSVLWHDTLQASIEDTSPSHPKP